MVYNSATPYLCLVDTLPFLLTFFGHHMILLAILYSMQHTDALTMSEYSFSLGLNFAC